MKNNILLPNIHLLNPGFIEFYGSSLGIFKSINTSTL